jgi:hypothetical protein
MHIPIDTIAPTTITHLMLCEKIRGKQTNCKIATPKPQDPPISHSQDVGAFRGHSFASRNSSILFRSKNRP